MDIETYAKLGLAIIGLIEVVKMAGFPTKYAPLLSALLGIGVLVTMGTVPASVPILTGIILGLDATGLFALVGRVSSNIVIPAVPKE